VIHREYAAAWIAMKGGEIVEARPTSYELIATLRERDIANATVIRVAGESEPELVGLG